jgi:hypothetical protein
MVWVSATRVRSRRCVSARSSFVTPILVVNDVEQRAQQPGEAQGAGDGSLSGSLSKMATSGSSLVYYESLVRFVLGANARLLPLAPARL